MCALPLRQIRLFAYLCSQIRRSLTVYLFIDNSAIIIFCYKTKTSSFHLCLPSKCLSVYQEMGEQISSPYSDMSRGSALKIHVADLASFYFHSTVILLYVLFMYYLCSKEKGLNLGWQNKGR